MLNIYYAKYLASTGGSAERADFARRSGADPPGAIVDLLFGERPGFTLVSGPAD
jgi:hypothetical protein